MDNSELLTIAQEYGTPTFVFDVEEFWRRLDKVADLRRRGAPLLCDEGQPFSFAGAAADHGIRLEVCSPGELAICEDVGISASQIVYSGVNKQAEDVVGAIRYRVGVLTAESKLHVKLIEECAKKASTTVKVLLRLNSGSQFGMSKADLLEVIDKRADFPHLEIVGLPSFVGTRRKKLKHQIREMRSCMRLSVSCATSTARGAAPGSGPGLAVPYFADEDFSDDLSPARELAPAIRELAKDVEVAVEMGRFFAAVLRHLSHPRGRPQGKRRHELLHP